MQILFEFLLELIIQTMAELLGIAVVQRWKNFPGKAWLFMPACAIIGALLGIISLAFLPTPYIHRPLLQWLNLLMTPLLVAAILETLGRWQIRHGKIRARLAIFGYAWILAFAFTAMRMLMR